MHRTRDVLFQMEPFEVTKTVIQVSHNIRVKKQRNILKEQGQKLPCYKRVLLYPFYNEVPLYFQKRLIYFQNRSVTVNLNPHCQTYICTHETCVTTNMLAFRLCNGCIVHHTCIIFIISENMTPQLWSYTSADVHNQFFLMFLASV